MDDAQPMVLKTQWDLSPLLSGDDDPKIDALIDELKRAYQGFVDRWEQRTDYLENPAVLKEALDDYELLAKNYNGTDSVGYYFTLRNAQDQTNAKVKSQSAKFTELEIKIVNDISFFVIRLGKVAPEIQKIMLESPPLEPYKHFLERVFETAKYNLSEAEEKILLLKSQTSYANWVNMVSEFVSKEEREVLDEDGQLTVKAFTDILNLVNSQNKEVRMSSARAVNKILKKHASVAEYELNSILQDHKVEDDLRRYDRPDKATHVVDDIDSQVVDVLVDAVSKRYDISARYYELKAKLLGVPKLKYYERNVSLGNLNKKFTYQKAVELVATTFDDLDPEFAQIFRKMIKNGQVDVYPKKGKYSSAFCTSKRHTDPVYILLNFAGKLDDVTTLAHEMGHAINATLSMQAQNALNSETPISTTEVSSIFMEDFVFERASLGYSSRDKLSMVMEKLDSDVSAIFRQVSCYQFEQDLHKSYREKNYLTKEEIGALFIKHMSAYMGDAVEQSPGSQNWWVYWSHIRSFFYVYSYASGQLISKALQNMVRQDKTAIAQVKKFLSAGLSKSPKELFLDMGIDITDCNFWNKGLNEVEQLLSQAESLAGQQPPSN